MTGNGVVGEVKWGGGFLPCSAAAASTLLHTVYTGWRLNSLTISLEICYCSLLKSLTESISAAGWLLRWELQ